MPPATTGTPVPVLVSVEDIPVVTNLVIVVRGRLTVVSEETMEVNDETKDEKDEVVRDEERDEVVVDEERVRVIGSEGGNDVSITNVVGSEVGNSDSSSELDVVVLVGVALVVIGGNLMTPLLPEGGRTSVAVIVARVGLIAPGSPLHILKAFWMTASIIS